MDNDESEIFLSVVASTALGFYFGLLSGPKTAWGPYPWSWLQSKLAIMVILALLPPVFLLARIGLEVARERKDRNKIVPFSRTDKK